MFAKAAYVFNAGQVDNFALPAPPKALPPIEHIERARQFIANTGAVINVGGERAYYRPSTDTIQMPDEHLFTGTDTMSRAESWHAVEAHEAIHWTSHANRLNRELGKRFGDRAYQAEELVAEIGSAMVCAMLEITQDVRPDHAQYLAHWLELMKSDPKAIFTAASKASQATASEAIVAAPELEVEARAPAPDESDRAPQRTPVVVNRRGQFDFGF